MKVCHITSGHSPRDGRIFEKMIMSLSTKYEVVEIAPNTADLVVNNIQIYGVSISDNKIKKLLEINRFFKKAIKINADIYHIHEPELIPVALKLKKQGKRIIYDSHEDTPMQILGMQWIPKIFRNMISYLFTHYEEKKIPQFDAVVSVTPNIVNRLRNYNANTYMITNYPIVNEYQDNRRWGKCVSFAGGISSQWMHNKILDAIAKTDARYILAGRYSEEYLDKLKSHDEWSNVIFKGLLPFSSIMNMIQESSAGMALNDYVANVGFHEGSLGNTKLFEYMLAGVPVIATDFVLWKEIITRHQCGICVNPHDEDQIAEAILFYVNNRDIAKQHGDNGRRAILNEYNWKTQEIILFEMYKKLEI
jgi:glycosyltransferase involved in cell wall biosynthesis